MGKRGKRQGKPRKRDIDPAAAKKAWEERPPAQDGYVDARHENPAFTQYYKAQGLVPEEEWDVFVESLRTSLPTTFRFISGSEAHDTREWMIREYFDIFKKAVDEEQVTTTDTDLDRKAAETFMAPTVIPWYPNELAWFVEIPRRVLRKNESLAKFHQWLVSENEMGTIYRQEAVSMIPVLFLDVKPHHYVLDMCAAPGSKTCQMLEILTANDDINTNGLMIANDSNTARAHMLIHQMKRLPTPCLLVTNHDAQFFPRLRTHTCDATGRTVVENILFDRILADVPCSGDGTLRKNLAIWAKWNPAEGRGLHNLQLAILDRACELLKVGGRVVYSTCSMNPIENEAVVAAMLARAPGTFDLLDVSHQVPGLKRRQGLSYWKVPSDSIDEQGQMVFYDEFELAPESKMKWTTTMWPPANVEELHLERCMRLLPHYQNTGGFFVAVIQKNNVYKGFKRPQKPKTEEVKKRASEELLSKTDGKRRKSNAEKLVGSDIAVEEPDLDESPDVMDERDDAAPDGEDAMLDVEDADLQVDEADAETVTADTQVQQPEGPAPSTLIQTAPVRGELPFHAYTAKSPDIKSIMDWYELDHSFPVDRVLGRIPSGAKSMWMASPAVQKVLSCFNAPALKVVYAGMKVFIKNAGDAKNGSMCTYRIENIAVPLMLPFLPSPSQRMVTISFDDLLTLIGLDYPKFGSFSVEVQEYLVRQAIGPLIMKFDPSLDTSGRAKGRLVNHIMYIPVWRAATSISVFLDKIERKNIYARLAGLEYEPTVIQFPVKNKNFKMGDDKVADVATSVVDSVTTSVE
ncbi:hypothetical protein SmJEL517_g06089 [Synchytrium microbalum]|uniref:SAM-dependent MTase RsmB/NOP-type domain-containing protein n=1 Tax=Synchytrium microbalum TaxID=1806994 RepID=A0A507BYC2_9FUNG|nr:uncharacterized protein SmJEL517_g06089 [Synchytrium microbalum]TPX30335.1 hypothetical protein SmJEL517_g06089 [Synchytrium microbalum]